MPNLEIPKLNIHPEPTPEQVQAILKEYARLEKTTLEIKNQIGNGKFKLQDNGLYSVEHSGLVDQNNNPIDSKTIPESKIIIPDSKIIIPESNIIIPESKIIDPATDPMMQIVDPQGNPMSSKEYVSTVKPPEAVEKVEPVVEEKAKVEKKSKAVAAPTAASSGPVIMPIITGPKPVVKGPEPVKVKTELEQVVARIREYNKNNTPLSPEDLKYRLENWGKVEVALMDLHKKEKTANPEPEVAHTFIEYAGPNLERSRIDYVNAIFNNRKALYENKQWQASGNGVVTETLDPANQQHLKILQKKYNDNIEAELKKVQPKNQEGGKLISMTQARLDFLQEERDQFNNELFLLDNEETKKRIGRALDKAFIKTGEITGDVGELAGKGVEKVGELTGKAVGVVGEKVGRGVDATTELVGKGVNNLIDRFKNKKGRKKGDGMPWWYYALAVPASPTALGVWAGGKLHEGVQDSIALLKKKFNQVVNPEKDKKKTDLKEKFGDKKPGEKKDGAVPGEAMQKTQEQIDKEKKLKEIEDRKNEFLEKAFGKKPTTEDLEKLEKLSKLSIKSFFDPERQLNKKLDTYTPWQRAIYDKLLPIYQKDTDPKKDKIKLKDYLTSLAEQDKLKDLWNQTSSSNS